MNEWVFGPIPGLIEPMIAPEIYVEEVGAIELIDGGNCRVHFCARQMPLEAIDGTPQNVVVLKMVRPVAGIAGAIGRMVHVINPCRSKAPLPTPWTPRIVR